MVFSLLFSLCVCECSACKSPIQQPFNLLHVYNETKYILMSEKYVCVELSHCAVCNDVNYIACVFLRTQPVLSNYTRTYNTHTHTYAIRRIHFPFFSFFLIIYERCTQCNASICCHSFATFLNLKFPLFLFSLYSSSSYMNENIPSKNSAFLIWIAYERQ